MKDNIDKIQTILLPEIEMATIRNNMNRITVALTESIRQLLEISKEVEQKLEELGADRKVFYVDVGDSPPQDALEKLTTEANRIKSELEQNKVDIEKKKQPARKKKAA